MPFSHEEQRLFHRVFVILVFVFHLEPFARPFFRRLP